MEAQEKEGGSKAICKWAGRNTHEHRADPERLLQRPTLPNRGEGCYTQGIRMTKEPACSCRGSGGSMSIRMMTQHGKPMLPGVSYPQLPLSKEGQSWESEALIVLMKPCKQGGGKERWVGYAF